jgi:hypothetical protein
MGDAAYVKVLLVKGADPDIIGGKGITPRQYDQGNNKAGLRNLIPPRDMHR